MRFALHEILEVHEMASFKALSLTKSKTMKALVTDPALKQLMEQDVETSTRQLKELEAICSKAAGEEIKA